MPENNRKTLNEAISDILLSEREINAIKCARYCSIIDEAGYSSEYFYDDVIFHMEHEPNIFSKSDIEYVQSDFDYVDEKIGCSFNDSLDFFKYVFALRCGISFIR